MTIQDAVRTAYEMEQDKLEGSGKDYETRCYEAKEAVLLNAPDYAVQFNVSWNDFTNFVILGGLDGNE